MTDKEVSENERTFIEGLLEATGDESEWFGWVSKMNKKDKGQLRLLVISQYRLLSIKKSKFGKKSICREAHFFDLEEITDDDENLTLKFKDFAFVANVLSSEKTEIINAVTQAVGKMSYDIAEDMLPVLPGGKVSCPHSDAATGLVAAYKSWCNYYKQKPSQDFKIFLEDTVKKTTGMQHVMNLTRCPGIEPKTDYTFHLLPVFATLKHSTQFTALIIRDVLRREAAEQAAVTFETNKTIQQLVLSGLDSPAPAFMQLGTALENNPSNGLLYMDFSNNQMGEKGVLALASGIKVLEHGLTNLLLGSNAITPKGILALIKALRDNEHHSKTLQELDLSNNNFGGGAASSAFSEWLISMKEYARLTSINLSGTTINSFTVVNAIRKGAEGIIKELDLSNNKWDRSGIEALSLLLENAQVLEVIDLSYSRLDATLIATLISSIRDNKHTQFSVNLSGNDIGPAGATTIGERLKSSSNIHTISFNETKLKSEGVSNLIEEIKECSSLTSLDIGNNVKNGEKGFSKGVDDLCEYLKSTNSLVSLSLRGGKQFYYGRKVIDIFKALTENSTIKSIDVSDNKFGDSAAIKICESLRQNSTISTMSWDGNSLNLGGLQAFRACLGSSNKVLCYVEDPTRDIQAAVNAAKDKQRLRGRLDEVLAEIHKHLESNGSGRSDEVSLPFNRRTQTLIFNAGSSPASPHKVPATNSPVVHQPPAQQPVQPPTQQRPPIRTPPPQRNLASSTGARQPQAQPQQDTNAAYNAMSQSLAAGRARLMGSGSSGTSPPASAQPTPPVAFRPPVQNVQPPQLPNRGPPASPRPTESEEVDDTDSGSGDDDDSDSNEIDYGYDD
eukprot:TRINITY_DN3811_c0_g1_i1.p1 TRINITY_DN3811_c0_g1~~TRINITY_DN3811_c0_g1_i1.p1  ORF type:complete len:843 (+),score=125.86 TRINITY_DN3811_c0_g1_i1:43-2571(+)